MLKKLLMMLCAVLLIISFASAEEDPEIYIEEIVEDVLITEDGEEILLESSAEPENPAREDFITRIIDMGHDLYVKADGKSQRAHYSGDIYVCKNFTTYLFRKNRDDFRMAEYPDTKLIIPNNLPSAKCRPYYYGMFWEDKTAAQGNPFEVGAQFLYDSDLSPEENFDKACDFMREARRGDFLQMSGQYEYGTGAHSAIIIADYDPSTDSVHWMDSNMRGKKVNGIRYGIVQFDEVRSVEWWAGTFCHKKRGATLYRLRQDIVYAEDVQ
ncbi:MAG: hypothetical protein IJV91_09515 [Kiritimatiellae bacterium]|nr:hypothetical protein [Clostridia bacterium]MBQ9741165.1 hypothetical protein [Kiritimatiellia bacterium]